MVVKLTCQKEQGQLNICVRRTDPEKHTQTPGSISLNIINQHLRIVTPDDCYSFLSFFVLHFFFFFHFLYHFVCVTLSAHHSCLLFIPGPMVWYQKFEYAVGHWLQKTAEHVFGSVLCSPGCFSLFRGSALMDDDVLKRYTTTATRASEYVQYDQGGHRYARTPTIFILPSFVSLPFFDCSHPFDTFLLCLACVCTHFQGRIVGSVLFYCSKVGVLNTMLHQMHTPTHHKSSKSFITREGDGDHLHWQIHWNFCTGYCYC